MLFRAAEWMRDRRNELASIEVFEASKPWKEADGDVCEAIDFCEYYAACALALEKAEEMNAPGEENRLEYQPRGVAAVITPWNFPLAILTGMTVAALVTGNTVVFKPSERTPLSAARLVELLDLPEGVCTLLHGDGRAGEALVEHPDVDLVMHTGSVATGRRIAEICARLDRKAILELGGKDPLIVDAGVDPRWAAEQAAAGAFANAGQICTSVERIYVHADVAEPFVRALVERAEALGVGDGADERTQMGPLVDERQRRTVHAHVTHAVQRGARVLTGGVVPDGAGAFYPPTVLVDVDDDMDVMRDETFGPVAAVRVVDSFEEALHRANGTAYGLAASVLTPLSEHAQQAWRELRVGTVKINNVWGGAPGGAAEPRKASGRGFGYGPELLDEVTRVKVVHLEPAPSLR